MSAHAATGNVDNNMSPGMHDMLQSVLSGYQRRPGASSMDDIMRHLSTKDPTQLQSLFSEIRTHTEATRVDLSTFDFSTLSSKRDSFWVVQLMNMGFQDENGRTSDERFPHSQPVFQIVVYDERGAYRVMEPCRDPGLPSSATVLEAIKKAMANPLPPLKAEYPEFLLLARKLSPHEARLRPFLNSLPAPFIWRLETAEEESSLESGIQEKNRQGVAKGLRSAEAEKELGNQAVRRGERGAAVRHYTEAIEALRDAWAQNPDEEQNALILALLTVCYGNRAAAWLLAGAGQEPRKALKDADSALEFDEDYGKAYYRKAKAHLLLSEPSLAIDVLTKALRRPTLAAERALNETLVEAYGGFPEQGDELRQFVHRIFNDEDGDERARDLPELRKLVTEHLQKTLGEGITIEECAV